METSTIRGTRWAPRLRLGYLLLAAALLLLAAGGGYLWYSAHSWGSYTDSHFRFRVEVPPGWHAGWWENMSSPLGDCSHDIDLLPPSTTASASRAAETLQPEVISIVVTVNCPGFVAGSSQFQNPTPLTIGGTPATLYENTSDPGDRVTHAVFGGPTTTSI